MTKFIELTGFDSKNNPNKFDVNVSLISSIEESLIYADGKGYYVKESRKEIKELIEQAEQENPYRTK